MSVNMNQLPTVIHHSQWQEPGDEDAFDWYRLLPAWIISGVIHVFVLSVFLLIYVGSSKATVLDMHPTFQLTRVASDEFTDVNTETIELGDDPEALTSYEVTRIEEVSVPGPDIPHEAIGIPDGSDMPQHTIAPPWGLDGGQGRGVDSGQPGRAPMWGRKGGYASGRPMLDPFAGRGAGATRERTIQQYGGNSRSEAAVAKGLKWLVRHQALNGRFSMHDFCEHGHCNCGNPGGSYDVGGTGLALLPLLGAGYTHKGTGEKHIYAKNVERALRWLIARQGRNGGFSENGYEHAIATLAICEAYGMSADPWLRGPAQRAINRCVSWQRPGGGFRYRHPQSDEDLSVTGWFVQALKSGTMAGLNVPNSVYAGINQYLDSVSDPSGGAYSYQPRRGPSPAMTAVGLLSRQYMGWNTRNPALQKGIENLQKVPPGATRNLYYYYYATQVLHHFGGESWQLWNPRMRDLLIDSQDQGADRDHRDQKGSWSPQGDAWGRRMGRLGHTALAILTLEVYYRYLPLYKRELGTHKPEAVR